MKFRYLLLICAAVVVANAQIQFHPGVVAGVPLTDTLTSSSSSSISPSSSSLDRYNSVTKRLLIGPTFRVELQRGVGFEFDALYQRLNYDHATSTFSPSASYLNQSFEQTAGNRWQFPLLLQYQATVSKTGVFVEGGPSISSITSSRGTLRSSTALSLTSASSSVSTITGRGGTLAGTTTGAGLDLHLSRWHLRPEFRYSHWFTASAASSAFLSLSGFIVPSSASSVSPSFRTTQNEASFLLGRTF